MTDRYDVVVLGAGPGGYVAAIRAAQLGQKVAIIEKEFMGGVCLNIGCIPTKSLLKNAEIAHTLQHGSKEFGFSFKDLELDYGVAFKRSRQVSQRLVKGVGFLMKKHKIDVYEGAGQLTGTHLVKVALNDGDEQVLDGILVSDLGAANPLAAAPLSPTKGFSRRGEWAWMARATSSFPVPRSPQMSTRARVGATIITCGMSLAEM